MSKDLVRGTSIVSILTIVSRILGFIWNLLLAKIFGAGAITDIFFVAYKVPNLLRSFLAEGALTSAFVPVFAEELHKSKEEAVKTMRSVISLLLITTISISILGYFLAPYIVELIAPGFKSDQEKFELCILLTRISLPYIIFVSLIALINGALNNVKIFGAAPLAQITMNCVLIAFSCLASFYDQTLGITLLSVSVILGGILQVFVQFPALKKAKFSILPSLKLITPATKKIIFLICPAIFGAAIYQISIFINTILASLLITGSISWLFYADRITQLPVGILTISLASVLLPSLSASAVSGDKEKFSKDLINSLRFLSFFMIPASFGLFILAQPITEVLFERGSFSKLDTENTALAIKAMAFGLWGISCNSLVNRAFLAKQDTVTPSLLGLVALIINVIIALLLMGTISLSQESSFANFIASIQAVLFSVFPSGCFGHVGLALASGLSITLVLLIAIAVLKFKENNIVLLPFLITTIKSLIASIAMAIVLISLSYITNNSLVYILVAIPLSIVVYFACAFLIKAKEFHETVEIFKK